MQRGREENEGNERGFALDATAFWAFLERRNYNLVQQFG